MPETPRRWPLPAVIGAIVLLAVVVTVAVTIASPPGRQPDRPTVQPTTPAPASVPATTAPASVPATTAPASPSSTADAGGLTDGIYEVGREIRAGAYTTTAGSRPCYWARLRSFGQANSVIDDHNLAPGERARVVVQPGDRGFKVSNGCTWQSVV